MKTTIDNARPGPGTVFTSNFAHLAQIRAAGLVPVAISRGIPVHYRGLRELRLAPARNMLKAPAAEFDRYYNDLLLSLDAREVYESLPPGAVLLCWEKPGEPCHRRSVAEWFEYHLGVVVAEFGYDRLATGWQEHDRYHFSEPLEVKKAKMALMLEGEVPTDDEPRN